MCFGLLSGEIPWILIERKTSRTMSRKFRGPRKPRASRKAMHRKIAGTSVTGLHSRALEAEARHGRQASEAWSCLDARACVVAHGQPCILAWPC